MTVTHLHEDQESEISSWFNEPFLDEPSSPVEDLTPDQSCSYSSPPCGFSMNQIQMTQLPSNAYYGNQYYYNQFASQPFVQSFGIPSVPSNFGLSFPTMQPTVYNPYAAYLYNQPAYKQPVYTITTGQIIPPPQTITQSLPMATRLESPSKSSSSSMSPIPPVAELMPSPLDSSSSLALVSSDGESYGEDKKRKASSRPFVRRVRQTRPKVVESKGGVQCKGSNRKKGIQCRNAALMEYIGPRPQYCAEHIQTDPDSLYEKCQSSYQKEPGDSKGCKEVVLKEFGYCFKHYGDLTQELIRVKDLSRLQRDLDRVSDLLSQLERDAAAAKKKDGDLYQRKNKLIPKFTEMKKIAMRSVDAMRSMGVSNGQASELPIHRDEMSRDGPPVVLALDLSSGEEDDLLSSPSPLSEEDIDSFVQ